MTGELLDATAGELVAALADKAISSVELTRAVIGRIEIRDAAINAVVVRDFERALEAARLADEALARGERRPLLGLPMTVKEGHNVAGLPTTWGIEQFASWIAPQDAPGVQRLKRAGAVILGKTNVPTNLADWQSFNPIYGRTVNPWDSARTAGGSSGGSAAALAARMVPLEFGSDIAGSIRVPSAFCGTYGHKPSYGLIPLRGHMPPGTDGAPPPLAVLGPMARSAADLELMMEVLVGPDADDSIAYRLELPKSERTILSDFRVLVLDRHPRGSADAEIRGQLAQLASALASRGAKVVDRSDALPDLERAQDAYLDMLMTVTSRGQPGVTSIAAHDFLATFDVQAAIRRAWGELFRRHDVVIAPVFGSVAFAHLEQPDQAKRTLEIDGRQQPFLDQMVWPGLASFANLPATAVPIGKSREGLPIGVQIIGPYLQDLSTLAFARLLEREFGGFTAPPGY